MKSFILKHESLGMKPHCLKKKKKKKFKKPQKTQFLVTVQMMKLFVSVYASQNRPKSQKKKKTLKI